MSGPTGTGDPRRPGLAAVAARLGADGSAGDGLDQVGRAADAVGGPDPRAGRRGRSRTRVAEQPGQRLRAARRRCSGRCPGARRTRCSCTRWALSCWSQKIGISTIGLPKCMASVVVLLPPWVMTRSTSGSTLVCGTNSAPHMLSASSSSSCRGPIDTMNRYGVPASAASVRCISSEVGAAQRAEAEVDQRPAVVGDLLGQLERRVGRPHRRLQPVPGRVQRPGVDVVQLLRVDVEVEPVRHAA